MSSIHIAPSTGRKPVFLDVKQTAALLGWKWQTLHFYRVRRPHRSPPWRKSGGSIVFELDRVLDWALDNMSLEYADIEQRARELDR